MMKTLIITVGNRQVGWRCRDGIIRSFGADGSRKEPPHLDELYQEFGIKRDFHDPEKKYRHSLRYLSEIVYRYCKAKSDFSQLVLLLDEQILVEHYATPTEPAEVILWGTDQPESVGWQFYAMDTCWLAQLMAGAIRQRYPHLNVTVWNCPVDVNQRQALWDFTEKQLEQYIKRLPENAAGNWQLQIQTKGSVPQMADALNMIAAVLMRQYPVRKIIPTEPKPFFDPSNQSARSAESLEEVSLGEVFWPLERQRIATAWKRGDFAAAKVLLEAHRDRHEALYQLADRLALATNWSIQDFLKGIQGERWLDQGSTRAVARKDQRQEWREATVTRCPNSETATSKFLKIWEFELLIDLSLQQANYTLAFMQFAQMLERLLFWRCEQEDWRTQGHLGEEFLQEGNYRDPTLGVLWRAWAKAEQRSLTDPFAKKLEKVNEYRNSVVHRNRAIGRKELTQLAGVSPETSPAEIHQGLLNVLCQVLNQEQMPEKGVARSLYEWGLEQLK
ncbi:hypothetical protein RHJ63_03875 [Thermosynechococcus sp. JY1334]|uniref:hypothetical protein n=1 Tax=unclassified Thermosynechococcus TaxID=2622553 RepID=UPI00267410E9|nr:MULTISPECIES: hypothetical protein [unclassified Thermosynechococcus]MDR7897444.1 hypothetical protein [Thermosynechococcus sp. JY1332]MDR7904849.1 hypothetical protein [Thermosynechococcus sp. JY1334]MDR7992674.1 hypothetical protein [Thermosynechococcus sp. TG252]WKT87073.1 hypothetical protein QYC30_03835 [Thermosynechococcus sp. JY1339]WNC56017.1 hypothetical protein RHJ31_03825 [Thermosynechococcus sp. JY1331]